MQRETDGTRRAAIFGFPAQFGSHRAAAVRLARPGVRRLALRAAAEGARRVLHQRHAGRQPDRPRDGQPRAQLRPRARDARAAEQQRPQLLPHLAAARRGVRRAAPGRRRRQAGAAPPPAAPGGVAAMALVTARPARGLGLQRLAEHELPEGGGGARRAGASKTLASAAGAACQNLVEVAPVLQALRNICAGAREPRGRRAAGR